MTSLQYLSVAGSRLQNSEQCEQLMEAIVANTAENPALRDINLFEAGGYDNKRFSEAALAHVRVLKDNGVTIAWTTADSYAMYERFQDIMN